MRKQIIFWILILIFGSSYGQEVNSENKSPNQLLIEKSLNDTTIDSYYKDIFRSGNLLSHPDDNMMLSITDSLFTVNPNRQLFYFLVFTKSMNKSDGFYSEAVGLRAFQFINEHTSRFADYFNIAPYLNDSDFNNWVNYICGEIMIAYEDKEEEAIKQLSIRLKENIKGDRKEYLIIVNKFIESLKLNCPQHGI